MSSWIFCFIVALLFVLGGLLIYLSKRKNGRRQVRYLGGGVFLAAVIICFPVLCQEENAGFSLLMSISHVIRMFVVDTGMADVTEGLHQSTLGSLFLPYKVFVCILYLCAPIFTLTIVLQYFSNIFEIFRLWTREGNSVYVFSELNSKSLEVAENIVGIIIFCRSSEQDEVNTELEEKARRLGAIFMQSEITHLRLSKKYTDVTYFQIAEDESENLDNTLKMIEKKSGGTDRRITIYCFATNHESEILIDAPEKGNLRVVLVDEVREAVYNHLYHCPLYLNQKPVGKEQKKISVLIIGGGKTGSEFLKAASWCGQMDSFDMDIHLFDMNSDLVEKRLKEESPELMLEEERYHLHFYQGNVFDKETQKELNYLNDISYCMISLGNDEDNIRIAVWLRKYFYLREGKEQPFICTYIKNKEKRSAIWSMYEKTRSGKKLYYNIIPFGGMESCIGGQSPKVTILEYLGLGIQFHYFRLMQDSSEEDRQSAIRNFYDKQFNRRSSIASGIHIEYKLWAVGCGLIKKPKSKEEKELFDKWIHPVSFLEKRKRSPKKIDFYNLEHERWMAFMRSEGWRLATRGDKSLKSIRECYAGYQKQFKNQNYLMKLHPGLVPISSDDDKIATLKAVEEMMKEVGNYNPDYVQSDIELVDNIDQIVNGAWCGKSGIKINGIRIDSGEYVICSLRDLQGYYKELYEKLSQKTDSSFSSEDLLRLRIKIKQCIYGVLQIDEKEELANKIYSFMQAEEQGIPKEE